MCDKCVVCGVTFNDSNFELSEEYFSLFKEENEPNLCYYCATVVPFGVVSLIAGECESKIINGKNYTKDNWMTEPITAKVLALGRDKTISGSQLSSCPRCNGKLEEKETENLFATEKFTIKKCASCGWC